ncbi:MAG TPA: DUF1580 domain-containing protein [Gemmataceae bacterium]|jgi:hypothetical protein|nr:DUF1580 domain-containing protein [Gemmataceae bacterium]
MAINLETERALRFPQAAQWVGRHLGRRIHVATLYRWCGGLRGRRLEYVQVGGTRVTTVEALERFFAGLATTETGETIRPEPNETQHAERVEAALRDRGV